MSSYQNVLLPKCLLPKRPYKSVLYQKCLDTICHTACVDSNNNGYLSLQFARHITAQPTAHPPCSNLARNQPAPQMWPHPGPQLTPQ